MYIQIPHMKRQSLRSDHSSQCMISKRDTSARHTVRRTFKNINTKVCDGPLSMAITWLPSERAGSDTQKVLNHQDCYRISTYI